MMWQYVAVGIALAAAVCYAVVRALSPGSKCPPDTPQCTGCPLAKSCKKPTTHPPRE